MEKTHQVIDQSTDPRHLESTLGQGDREQAEVTAQERPLHPWEAIVNAFRNMQFKDDPWRDASFSSNRDETAAILDTNIPKLNRDDFYRLRVESTVGRFEHAVDLHPDLTHAYSHEDYHMIREGQTPQDPFVRAQAVMDAPERNPAEKLKEW